MTRLMQMQLGECSGGLASLNDTRKRCLCTVSYPLSVLTVTAIGKYPHMYFYQHGYMLQLSHSSNLGQSNCPSRLQVPQDSLYMYGPCEPSPQPQFYTTNTRGYTEV